MLGGSWRLAAAVLSLAQAAIARVVQMAGLCVAFMIRVLLVFGRVPMR